MCVANSISLWTCDGEKQCRKILQPDLLGIRSYMILYGIDTRSLQQTRYQQRTRVEFCINTHNHQHWSGVHNACVWRTDCCTMLSTISSIDTTTTNPLFQDLGSRIIFFLDHSCQAYFEPIYITSPITVNYAIQTTHVSNKEVEILGQENFMDLPPATSYTSTNRCQKTRMTPSNHMSPLILHHRRLVPYIGHRKKVSLTTHHFILQIWDRGQGKGINKHVSTTRYNLALLARA